VIVIDASAMVEALVGRYVDADLLNGLSGDVDAPHLLDVEVISVLRGLELGRKLTPAVAKQARHDHFAFTITRHDLEPAAERIWGLRRQFTTYDAAYIALAEALAAPLYTCDTKLTARGHAAEVRVVSRTH
jgi:predicted nucleic acid-binding protein